MAFRFPGDEHGVSCRGVDTLLQIHMDHPNHFVVEEVWSSKGELFRALKTLLCRQRRDELPTNINPTKPNKTSPSFPPAHDPFSSLHPRFPPPIRHVPCSGPSCLPQARGGPSAAHGSALRTDWLGGTRSDALVSTSFLFLVAWHLLLEAMHLFLLASCS